MNKQRIKEVFSDEAFVKQLLEQEEAEQVQALLAEKGIDLSINEIVKIQEKLVKHLNGESNEDELSDDELADVAGGLLLEVVPYMVEGILEIGVKFGKWVKRTW